MTLNQENHVSNDPLAPGAQPTMTGQQHYASVRLEERVLRNAIVEFRSKMAESVQSPSSTHDRQLQRRSLAVENAEKILEHCEVLRNKYAYLSRMDCAQTPEDDYLDLMVLMKALGQARQSLRLFSNSEAYS